MLTQVSLKYVLTFLENSIKILYLLLKKIVFQRASHIIQQVQIIVKVEVLMSLQISWSKQLKPNKMLKIKKGSISFLQLRTCPGFALWVE